ncbi:hypothetical protein [Burkholderia sp. Ac-20392]|uniref:hypothetical protein n=1 Tax=Burkholderia sp. Ac-20392 TaxID=2703905 RepID=UPI0019801A0E|nr:hypothetical protein [Burkholderia sp. Ac-20392]MBN3801407.1 hypothetical protein [Burkholderia sp. Ac-20392]
MVGVFANRADRVADVDARRGESRQRQYVRCVGQQLLVVELQFVEFVQFQLVQFEQLWRVFVE